MNNFKELKVWHKAVDLAVYIYKVTESFPEAEKFGMTSQMRRSATSISSNIAEGAGRNGKKEFANFLGIANGSASELSSQLVIAGRLNYVTEVQITEADQLVMEIQKMLRSLHNKLNQHV